MTFWGLHDAGCTGTMFGKIHCLGRSVEKMNWVFKGPERGSWLGFCFAVWLVLCLVGALVLLVAFLPSEPNYLLVSPIAITADVWPWRKSLTGRTRAKKTIDHWNSTRCFLIKAYVLEIVQLLWWNIALFTETNMTVQILLAITTASLVPLTNLLLRIWSVCVQNITWTMNMQVMRRVKSRKLGVEINVNQWEKFRAPVANRNHWYNNSWWKWFPNVQNVLILNGCCEPMFLGNICQTGQTGTFLESNGSENTLTTHFAKTTAPNSKLCFEHAQCQ